METTGRQIGLATCRSLPFLVYMLVYHPVNPPVGRPSQPLAAQPKLPMIGIYDSGIGGLLLASALEQRLPQVELVYCNDTARAPLSAKSREMASAACRSGLSFLLDQGAKLLVVASNSAACNLEVSDVPKDGPPLLTPITSTVDQAISATREGRIGIIAGPAVIASGLYDREILGKMGAAKVVTVSCPLLAPLVEVGWSNKQETKMVLRRYLHPLKEQQIDTLILASGHHSQLRHLIQARAGKRVRLIDSSQALIDQVLRLFAQPTNRLTDSTRIIPRHRYFVSDRNPSINTLASRILGRPVQLLSW